MIPQLGKELEGYTSTSGSLHFPLDQPLPEALMRKLLAVRMTEAFGRRQLPAPIRERSHLAPGSPPYEQTFRENAGALG